MAESQNEAIATFQGVTGLRDTELATRFLNGVSWDVQAAICEYFDKPDKHDHVIVSPVEFNPNQYSEYTGYEDNSIPSMHGLPPSYTAQSYEQEMAMYDRSGVATRPNSRKSSISPMSPQETYAQQVTGVIPPTEPYVEPQYGSIPGMQFDDAHYITAPTQSADLIELLPDLEPLERLRQSHEPGYVKPCSNGDPLSAILVILAQIPLAQKLLLQSNCVSPNYGKNPSWWAGASIEPLVADAVTNTLPGTTLHPEDSAHLQEQRNNDELLFETQRIMASLLYSDRAYISAESLIHLNIMRDTQYLHEIQMSGMGFHNYVDRFTVAWSNASRLHAETASRNFDAKPSDSAPRISTPQTPTNNLSDNSESSNLFRTIAVEGENVLPLHTMELRIEPLHNIEPQSLYDCVDFTVWKTNLYGEQEDSVFLKSIPHVLVLRIVRNARQGRSIGIDIPSEFYLDRWIEAREKEATKLRQAMKIFRDQIDSLEHQKQALGDFRYSPPFSQASRSIMLLENAISYINKDVNATKIAFDKQTGGKEKDESHVKNDNEEENEDDDVDDSNDIDDDEEELELMTDQHRATQLAEKLQDTLENLKFKLNQIQLEKEQISANLHPVTNFLKNPDPAFPESFQPTHLYHLRGVCTNSRRVYFVKDSDNPNQEENWCGIEYTNVPALTRVTLSLEQVLNAARNESAEIVLVYASAEACKSHSESLTLPQSLKEFIERDNETFRQERQEAELLSRQLTVTNPDIENMFSYENHYDYGLNEPLLPHEYLKKDHKSLSNGDNNEARSELCEPNLSNDAYLPSYDDAIHQRQSPRQSRHKNSQTPEPPPRRSLQRLLPLPIDESQPSDSLIMSGDVAPLPPPAQFSLHPLQSQGQHQQQEGKSSAVPPPPTPLRPRILGRKAVASVQAELDSVGESQASGNVWASDNPTREGSYSPRSDKKIYEK